MAGMFQRRNLRRSGASDCPNSGSGVPGTVSISHTSRTSRGMLALLDHAV